MYAIVLYTRVEVSLPATYSKVNNPEKTVRMNFVWKGVSNAGIYVHYSVWEKWKGFKGVAFMWPSVWTMGQLLCLSLAFLNLQARFWTCLACSISLGECCGSIAQGWWKTFKIWTVRLLVSHVWKYDRRPELVIVISDGGDKRRRLAWAAAIIYHINVLCTKDVVCCVLSSGQWLCKNAVACASEMRTCIFAPETAHHV